MNEIDGGFMDEGLDEYSGVDEMVLATIASDTLLGDLMSFLIDELKTMPDVWQRMSESAQKDVIERCEIRIEKAVDRAVKLVACGEYVTVDAILHKMTIQKGVDITLKAGLTNELQCLQHYMDGYVKIVLPNKKQFTENRETMPVADPDQADLMGIGEEYDDDCR